jgi:tetratricopeptide (TPR) repeat protein
LTEARSHYERASDIFRRYIGEQSVAYSGHLIRGAALEAASGRWETAEQLLLKILGAWPAPPVDLPELYIKAMLELSRLRLAQGRNESALAVATGLVEKIRRSPDREHLLSSEAAALQLGGEARTRLGRAADAEGDLRRAVELRAGLDDAISPWLAEARVSLARCLMARHRTAEARSLLALASSAQAAQPALAEQYRAPLRQALRVLGEQ